MFSLFHPLRQLLTLKLSILPIAAALLTYTCTLYHWDFKTSEAARFFFVCIFFCFGILVGTADRRRFQAFESLAAIKASLITYWNITLAQNLSTIDQQAIKNHLQGVLPAIYQFLRNEHAHHSAEELHQVDQKIHRIALAAEILRKNGMQSPEVSRLHEFLEQIYHSFEILLSIKEYRTPITLLSFLKVSLVIALLLLSPGFSQLGSFGVLISAVIGLFLACLIEIQQKIEHPFRAHAEEIKEEFLERFQARIDHLETINNI